MEEDHVTHTKYPWKVKSMKGQYVSHLKDWAIPFKDWLVYPSPSSKDVYWCSSCKQNIRRRKYNAELHAQSAKHKNTHQMVMEQQKSTVVDEEMEENGKVQPSLLQLPAKTGTHVLEESLPLQRAKKLRSKRVGQIRKKAILLPISTQTVESGLHSSVRQNLPLREALKLYSRRGGKGWLKVCPLIISRHPRENGLWPAVGEVNDCQQIAKRAQYVCCQCKFTTPSLEELKAHELHHGRTKKMFACILCSCKFHELLRLKKHLLSHDTLSCPKCGFKCISEPDFRVHMLSHSEIFKCSKCDFECYDISMLETHCQSDHSMSTSDFIAVDIIPPDSEGESNLAVASYNFACQSDSDGSQLNHINLPGNSKITHKTHFSDSDEPFMSELSKLTQDSDTIILDKFQSSKFDNTVPDNSKAQENNCRYILKASKMGFFNCGKEKAENSDMKGKTVKAEGSSKNLRVSRKKTLKNMKNKRRRMGRPLAPDAKRQIKSRAHFFEGAIEKQKKKNERCNSKGTENVSNNKEESMKMERWNEWETENEGQIKKEKPDWEEISIQINEFKDMEEKYMEMDKLKKEPLDWEEVRKEEETVVMEEKQEIKEEKWEWEEIYEAENKIEIKIEKPDSEEYSKEMDGAKYSQELLESPSDPNTTSLDNYFASVIKGSGTTITKDTIGTTMKEESGLPTKDLTGSAMKKDSGLAITEDFNGSTNKTVDVKKEKIGKDPALWDLSDNDLHSLLLEMGPEPFQNLENDSSKSRNFNWTYSAPRCSSNLGSFSLCFVNQLKREKAESFVTPEWVLYSPSTKRLYCFYCSLFSEDVKFSVPVGVCSDGKNEKIIDLHAQTFNHKEACDAYKKYKAQRLALNKNKYNTRVKILKSLIKGILPCIMFLIEQGSFPKCLEISRRPFYSGLISLMGKHDPSVKKYYETQNTDGEDKFASVFSIGFAEEFFLFLRSKMLNKIAQDVKQSKSFTICIDSAVIPEVQDHLTVSIRYTRTSGPIELLLIFIPVGLKSGTELANCLLQFLSKNDINIKFCQGQVYDDTSHMTQRYTEMQECINRVCVEETVVMPRSPYLPDSLIRIAKSVADECPVFLFFLKFIDRLFTFFAKSGCLWQRLETFLPPFFSLPPKDTCGQWSLTLDAVIATLKGYEYFQLALDNISTHTNYLLEDKMEALELASEMKKLETGILVEVWSDIFQALMKCRNKILISDMDIANTVTNLNILMVNLKEIQKKFDTYEQCGFLRSLADSYEPKKILEKSKTSIFYDKGTLRSQLEVTSQSKDIKPTSRFTFKAKTFNFYLNTLFSVLSTHNYAFNTIQERFLAFSNYTLLSKPTQDDIHQWSEQMWVGVQNSPNLQDFGRELALFFSFLSHQNPPSPQEKSASIWMHQTLESTGKCSVFPNVTAALKTFLSYPVSFYSQSISISVVEKLKLVDAKLITRGKIHPSVYLTIEQDYVKSLDFEALIVEFAKLKEKVNYRELNGTNSNSC